jgi:hypothetical protein
MPQSLADLAMAWQIEAPFWGQLLSAMPSLVDRRTHYPYLSCLPPGVVCLVVPPNISRCHEAIKHELVHWSLGHPVKANAFSWRTLFDIAADFEVRQLLQEDSYDVDPSIMPFTDTYLDSDYYYAFLAKQITRRDEPFLSMLAARERQTESHRHWFTFHNIPHGHVGWKSWITSVRNHLPAGLALTPAERRLLYPEEKSTMAWQQLLRNFATSHQQTRLKHTLHRPSKRYGTRPGITIATTTSLLIALDTSGSIHARDLSRFLDEIDRIYHFIPNITLVTCDNTIRNVYSYRGMRNMAMQGGGGTSFDPVFIFAHQQKYERIIYFTDGKGMPPQSKPLASVLWVISPGGISEKDTIWHQLPGQCIKMTSHDEHSPGRFR